MAGLSEKLHGFGKGLHIQSYQLVRRFGYAVAVIILVAFVIIAWTDHHDVLESSYATAATRTRILEKDLVERIQVIDNILAVQATRVGTAGIEATCEFNNITTFIPYIQTLFVTDRDGETVCQSGRLEAGLLQSLHFNLPNPLDEDDGRMRIEGPIRLPGLVNTPFLCFSRIIHGATGEAVGQVIAFTDSNFLAGSTLEFIDQDKHELALFTQDGTALALHSYRPARENWIDGNQKIKNLLAQDQQGTHILENAVVSLHKVGPYPLSIIYLLDLQDAFTAWDQRKNLKIAMALLGAFLAVGLSQGLARQIRIRDKAKDERRLRAARDSANKAKSDFLTNVSHELRTPLNAIIGFSELLLKEANGSLSPQYREYTSCIYESGDQLLNIINDILDLSKLESGRMQLNEEPFDLNNTIRSCRTLFKETAKQNDLSLRSKVEANVPLFYGDERKTKRILHNLLSNSVKFTPGGGSINLSAHLDEQGNIKIKVADNGVGMTGDEIRIACENFGQADSSLTRLGNGTGLGLPLAKGLVKLQGGHMDIDSAPGQGTTVTVVFPRERILKI